MPERAKKPLPPDAPCPCDSGKKYGDCCTSKGFDWVVDDEGEIYRIVPMPPDLRGLLENQRKEFVAEHGREPAPDDPLFSDLPHPEHLEAELAEVMRAAGLPPEFVYAFEKTGLLLTEENRNLIPDKDVEAWRAAVEEFHALGGDPWTTEENVTDDDEERLGAEQDGMRPLPTREDWVPEIALAYRGALHVKDLGGFAPGEPLADDDLFQIAPHVFLTVRGGDIPNEERDDFIESTLESYAETMAEGDFSRFVIGSPILAFAFCYLLAHAVAGLLNESELLETFDDCLTGEDTLEELVGEDETPE